MNVPRAAYAYIVFNSEPTTIKPNMKPPKAEHRFSELQRGEGHAKFCHAFGNAVLKRCFTCLPGFRFRSLGFSAFRVSIGRLEYAASATKLEHHHPGTPEVAKDRQRGSLPLLSLHPCSEVRCKTEDLFEPLSGKVFHSGFRGLFPSHNPKP